MQVARGRNYVRVVNTGSPLAENRSAGSSQMYNAITLVIPEAMCALSTKAANDGFYERRSQAVQFVYPPFTVQEFRHTIRALGCLSSKYNTNKKRHE